MKVSAACLVLLAQPTAAFVANSRTAAFRPRVALSVVSDPTETINGVVTEKEDIQAEEPAAKAEVEPAVAVAETPKAEVEPAVAVAETPKAEESKAPVAAQSKPASSIPVPPVFADEVKPPLEPGRLSSLDYSITLPFLARPTHLDGSHAGDFGFDPLGLSQEYDLYYMQECETRHARLALLAVVGWPLSELVAPDFMLQDGRAPSVLNGFNPISAVAVLAMFGAIGALEFTTALRRTYDTPIGRKHLHDMSKIWGEGVAGDYNFDPLNFYSLLGDDADGRKALRQLEITQGRYAMLGITFFALWEAVSGRPIVENNIFFHPNAILPVLGAAYLYVSTLYEFSDVREYPIKFQKSKLGLELDEWLERRSDSY